MSEHEKTYEIRDAIHGFITLDAWEWDVINQPAFQRLRRIRQLALTDLVYPGANHTRFEHSLGVLHVASELFDSLHRRRMNILKGGLGYRSEGIQRDRALVRMAALLHDIGHAPFSHPAEDLLPMQAGPPSSPPVERFQHEHYTTAIILHELKDVIEGHRINRNNYALKAQDLADFFTGAPGLGAKIIWRELISGQMDADRMDYLLRDSHHLGVAYGRYDLARIVATASVVERPEEESRGVGFSLAVDDDGAHAAEALIMARYLMFTQVYFHRTRRAYDYHLTEAMRTCLAGDGTFPPPRGGALKEFLRWDDWRVLGHVAAGEAGEHGCRILQRNHYRRVYETPEVPQREDFDAYKQAKSELESIGCQPVEDMAENSWYKFAPEEILLDVHDAISGAGVELLSNPDYALERFSISIRIT